MGNTQEGEQTNITCGSEEKQNQICSQLWQVSNTQLQLMFWGGEKNPKNSQTNLKLYGPHNFTCKL